MRSSTKAGGGFVLIREWVGAPSQAMTKALLLAVTAPLFGMMGHLLTERARALGIIGPEESLEMGMGEVWINRGRITQIHLQVNYLWGGTGSLPFAILDLEDNRIIVLSAAGSGKTTLEAARPDVGTALGASLRAFLQDVANQPGFDFHTTLERMLRRLRH